jgi:hypothetical protein
MSSNLRPSLESMIVRDRGSGHRVSNGVEAGPDEIEVAQAFLDLVLKKRIQCLSQIQYETGYSLERLRAARDLLLDRRLIEPLRGYSLREIDAEQVAYKLAI